MERVPLINTATSRRGRNNAFLHRNNQHFGVTKLILTLCDVSRLTTATRLCVDTSQHFQGWRGRKPRTRLNPRATLDVRHRRPARFNSSRPKPTASNSKYRQGSSREKFRWTPAVHHVRSGSLIWPTSTSRPSAFRQYVLSNRPARYSGVQ